MKIKAIIFDFDGVLAESVHIKSEAFYKLYLPFGEDVAQKVLVHHLENGGMSRFDKFKIYHEKYLNITLNESGLNELVEGFSDLVKNAVVAVNEVKGANQFLNEDRNIKYWIRINLNIIIPIKTHRVIITRSTAIRICSTTIISRSIPN